MEQVEIRPDVAEEQQGFAPARRRTRRGKIRLVTLDALDARTAAAQAARALINSLTASMGGELSAGEQQLVQRAAMLGAIAAHHEALWVAGQAVELSEYLSAVNVQRRVLATLGLERRSRLVGSSLHGAFDHPRAAGAAG